MCNCGNKRSHSRISREAESKKENPAQEPEQVLYEYTGKTALTIVGNVTRKHYRFNYPGDKQNIDSRDSRSMTTVPVLKKVG